MKHWQETRNILDRVATVMATHGHAAVATVVRVFGSAYRRPGSKLLITSGGSTSGAVSGGCLEADVIEIGKEVIRENVPRLRRYDTGADEDTVWGLGLGCEGTVEVLIQPVHPDGMAVWQKARQLLDGQDTFAICTVLRGTSAGRCVLIQSGAASGTTGDPALDAAIAERAAHHIEAGVSRSETIAGTDVFFDILIPPPWLLIIGAGDDAKPLAHIASVVGFRVAVVDHRPAFPTAERYPDADKLVHSRFDDADHDLQLGPDVYAVVMTHSLVHDRGWMEFLLTTDVPYIGILGPRKRIDHLFDSLEPDARERVFGPVGLDIGADGAEQIAVAVLAEVMSVRSARLPQHLKNRLQPIHAG